MFVCLVDLLSTLTARRRRQRTRRRRRPHLMPPRDITAVSAEETDKLGAVLIDLVNIPRRSIIMPRALNGDGDCLVPGNVTDPSFVFRPINRWIEYF